MNSHCHLTLTSHSHRARASAWDSLSVRLEVEPRGNLGDREALVHPPRHTPCCYKTGALCHRSGLNSSVPSHMHCTHISVSVSVSLHLPGRVRSPCGARLCSRTLGCQPASPLSPTSHTIIPHADPRVSSSQKSMLALTWRSEHVCAERRSMPHALFLIPRRALHRRATGPPSPRSPRLVHAQPRRSDR